MGAPQPGRPLPAADDLTRPHWDAARAGRLEVQRCHDCGLYAHPPTPCCHRCLGTDLGFEVVSGRGTVYSVTETWSGARHPYFAERVPYPVAIIELDDQPGLLMYSNLPGTAAGELPRAGAVVHFVGDEADGIPDFAVTDTPTSEAPH